MKRNSTVRVAVTSRSFSRNQTLRSELLARYENVTFNEEGKTLRGSALAAFLAGHERAIVALEPIDEELLTALPELKVVSKYGVGFDNIDFEALRRRNIRLNTAQGVTSRSVSELVLSFAISLLRQLPRAAAELRAGAWKQIDGFNLSGKTFGIVGCGHIGRDLAKLLTPFRCQLLTYDLVPPPPEFCEEQGVEVVSLEELLKESHVVSLHVPLIESTLNLISRERLQLMRQGAILINVARGKLIDEVALLEFLRSGQLGGAALDVFAQEPPQNLELLELPNFIGTPHIGGSTEEANLAKGRAAISGLDLID